MQNEYAPLLNSARKKKNNRRQTRQVQAPSESTIRYAEGLTDAAQRAGVTGRLETRKPHTKLGTGSSGTQHDVADGRAATGARDVVEDAIYEKTGAHQSIGDFLKQEERKEAAEEKRAERQSEMAQKRREIMETDDRDFKIWIAHLAPQTWKARQDALGNDYYKPAGKYSTFEAKATAKKWPLEWRDELGAYIFR